MKRLKKLQESLPTEDFTPRDYQLDLLESARLENTVAALGSDGGKSFLALSLLRELAQEVRRKSEVESAGEKNLAFVCVETDEAAVEYIRCVDDHTDFIAGKLCDVSTLESLSDFDVIVSSHEIFLNFITARKIDPRNIGIIVIDECTTAVSKYPYGEFIRSTFDFKNGNGKRKKPRILALTSSLLTKDVVLDPGNLESLIRQLETAFQSDLKTSVSLISVDRFGYSKAVKVMPYNLAVDDSLRECTETVRAKLRDLETFIIKCESVSGNTKVKKSESLSKSTAFSIFKVAAGETLECLRVLGLWPTYRLINIIQRDFKQAFLKNLMEQRIMRLVLAVQTKFLEIGIFMEKSLGFNMIQKGDPRILHYVSEKLKIIVNLLDPYNPQNPDDGKPYTPVQYLSMIINVNRPYLVWAINRFLRDLKGPDKKSRYSFVASSYCLGSFSSGDGVIPDASYFGMPFKVQEEMLRRFRNRDFNILVSTCTNDISLDVPQCTFTIQFDEVTDYLTFIHARHRTKSKYGSLCLLISAEREEDYRRDYFSKFEQIDSILLSRCPDYIVRSNVPTDLDMNGGFTDVLRAQKTGVQITLNQAVAVVNKYCSNLPSDAFANLTPLSVINHLDGVLYECVLTLPINAPLKRSVSGKPSSSKRLAKQSAAMEVCKILYDIGELDESLAPVSKDTWKSEIARFASLEPQEHIPDGAPKPGTTKRRQYYEKKIPSVLTNALPSSDSPAFLFAIEMKLTCPVPQEQNVRGRQIRHPEDATRILGILSSKRLPDIPDFNIYDRSGEIRVAVKLVGEALSVGDREFAMAHHFHNMLFSHVLALERFSLSYDPENAPARFLVVPLSKRNCEYVVDWSYMESVFAVKSVRISPVSTESRISFSTEVFSDAVVMPWYRSLDQPQSFYVEQICPWLTVKSEFPDGEFDTFSSYYLQKYKLDIIDGNQPLLDVDHTSTRLNLLLPRFLSRKGSSLTQMERKEMLKEKEPRHRQILVPELCQVHPVPASLWRQGICLPTILHRMESLLVMEEMMNKIKKVTGIGSRCSSVEASWPMLDYGWSFEEKIRKLESSHLERDDIDEKTAGVIEAARIEHERRIKERDGFPSVGMWSANELPEVSNGTDDFTIDVWNPEDPSSSMVGDTWNASDYMNDIAVEAPVPFFDHMSDVYLKRLLDEECALQNKVAGGKLKPGEVSDIRANGSGTDFSISEWGCEDDSGLPGISLLSGFSDNVMKAIANDLTSLNIDDSGVIGTSEIGDDTATVADSIMTTLPTYNLEALDPLKDHEEEEIGPVISSILHLRFSESAPEDLRTRATYFHPPSSDVFEEMTEFSLENVANREKKSVSFRAEFGEVARCSSAEREPMSSSSSRSLTLITPTFKFDDDRDPATVVGPDPGILLQAFTSSNSNDGINLERLETVGDSFLKFSMTTFLYFRYSGYHEGKLSFMRSLQVSNYNLYRLGFKKQLGGVILSNKFEPTENWLPPCYVLNDGNSGLDDGEKIIAPNLRTQHCISDKTIADCVEALIGAYLVSSGVKAAQLVMAWLGLTVLPLRAGAEDYECMLDKFTWFPKPQTVLLESGPSALNELDRLLDGYSKFEDRIGYRFRDRAYLLQAFTHASYTYNRVTDCYQRLEFLGDAVLDYLITRHLYEDMRGHTPGALTDLRSALVNNAIFASLSVRYEFHKYIKLMSPAIFHLVEKYVKEQRERDQNVTLFTEDIFFYDPAVDEDALEDEGGAEETECPKVLGDVFESVAGAIYLDSGMSLDAVWRVYYSMMKSEIEQCSSNIPKSPVRELLEMEPENVKFSVPERTASGKIRVVVEVFDKGKFVGLGRNYRTAKCTAAKQALKYLRSLEERLN